MNIKWFKKQKKYARKTQKADCTVNVTKANGSTISIRNGFVDEISPETHCMIVGVADDDSNVLLFMASDERNGWKASEYKTKNGDTTYRLHIKDDDMSQMLARFVGDYSFDICEDTGSVLYCINRRNVL